MKWTKANWTKYEHEFYDYCIEKKWLPKQNMEDGTPYLEPANKNKIGIYEVYAHGPGVCAIMITAEGPRATVTKNSILKKLIKANIISGTVSRKNNAVTVNSPDILTDGDAEAIAIFKIDRLPRAVKTLNLRKKKDHAGPPPEAREKGQEALRAMRENHE